MKRILKSLLDKFYTKEEIAISCIAKLNLNNYDLIIDPCCGDGAFYKNDNIKSIYLPDSVKKIGDEAFGDMKNLQSIRFSNSIKELDYAIFNKCKKLTTVKLPKKIQTIRGTFGGKKNCYLKKVYINATSLKKCNLKSIPKTCKIYVKNKKVKQQVKGAGFKGKILIR